jgi:hypothetical protein
MAISLLALNDVCLGTGAVVGLAIVALLSVKLWREDREMQRLTQEQEPGNFLNAFYKLHPEARPLSKRKILATFLALLVALIVLLVVSRR